MEAAETAPLPPAERALLVAALAAVALLAWAYLVHHAGMPAMPAMEHGGPDFAMLAQGRNVDGQPYKNLGQQIIAGHVKVHSSVVSITNDARQSMKIGAVLDPAGKPLAEAKLQLEYYRITQPATEYGPSYSTSSGLDGPYTCNVYGDYNPECPPPGADSDGSSRRTRAPERLAEWRLFVVEACASSRQCGRLKMAFIVFGLLMLSDAMSDVSIVPGGWLSSRW